MRPLNKEICSYWDNASHSCRLIKDGLFLPIEQHVITYCQSDHYPLCPHYQLLAKERSTTRTDAPPLRNRRRSNRLPCQHIFHFFEISDGEQRPEENVGDAWPIDLSEHGVRLATRQLLSRDSTVRFILMAGESSTSIEGAGRVIWSEPIKNTTLFQSGIDFATSIPSSPLHTCA